jgi:hypothetical protein
VDPLAPKYPELTPYQFSSNNPIGMIEIEGLEGDPVNTDPTKVLNANSPSPGNSIETPSGTVTSSNWTDADGNIVNNNPNNVNRSRSITLETPTPTVPNNEHKGYDPVRNNNLQNGYTESKENTELAKSTKCPARWGDQRLNFIGKHRTSHLVNLSSDAVIRLDTDNYKNRFKIKQDGKVIWDSKNTTPDPTSSRTSNQYTLNVNTIGSSFSGKMTNNYEIIVKPTRAFNLKFEYMFKMDVYSIDIFPKNNLNPRFL